MSDLARLASGEPDPKHWELLSPKQRSDLNAKLARFNKRAGGARQAVGAAVVGGLTGAVVFRQLPYLPAAAVGAAGGVFAVQLPGGNRLGESARTIGEQVADGWDAVVHGR